MPNRLLRESICRSESIDALSWFEEVLFYRLIVNCDDYGRFDGRPAIIKGSLFPLKDVAIKDIEKALGKLVALDMIVVYEAEGKPVLQLLTWDKYQTKRALKSKYPAYDNNYKLMYANASKCSTTSIPLETEPDEDDSSEQIAPVAPAEPPVITLLLNTGQEFGITSTDIISWEALYPAVDVLQELRAMKGWCEANPKKRKTASGIKRFVNGWLAKVQNQGGTGRYGGTQRSSEVGEFADMARRWAADD